MLSSTISKCGSAYTKQGGTNHVNEQPHTYWADLFLKHGYVPFDLFHPVVWGDADVEFRYQQNTFLYVNRNGTVFDQLLKLGRTPVANSQFLNCIHPILHTRYTEQSLARLVLKSTIIGLIPLQLLSWATKMKRALLK